MNWNYFTIGLVVGLIICFIITISMGIFILPLFLPALIATPIMLIKSENNSIKLSLIASILISIIVTIEYFIIVQLFISCPISSSNCGFGYLTNLRSIIIILITNIIGGIISGAIFNIIRNKIKK